MVRSFAGLLAWSILAGSVTLSAADGPDFNREVRPILSQFCFKCHGPDEAKRESGVRLDVRETAIGKGESGALVVVPGKPELSELIRRIESHDDDLVMPPASSNLQLSSKQKQTLRAWVAAGADYHPHWAFVPPQAVQPPVVQQRNWPRSSLDAFVLARLERAQLAPSPEAERATLLRRVSLDLTGLPPTDEEAARFLNDRLPGAYERLVDRLLASPSYGERWARRWLDLARYADTNGYEKDRPRSIWPYRDWVINALNDDLPFDQFTIRQLAGDLLPGATDADRIATGFHRNTMINEEGGIDPLEFRFHAMTDRMATTGAAWLGLTIGCAQCHTHKYDPLLHQDYYRMMAFLNNADEPEYEVWTPAAREERTRREDEYAVRERALPSRFPPTDEWTWVTPKLVKATGAHRAELKPVDDGAILVSGNPSEVDTYTLTLTTEGPIGALQLEALTDPSLGQNGPGRTPHGNFVLTEVKVNAVIGNEPAQPIKLTSATADFSQKMFPAANAIDGQLKTGWAIHGDGVWNVNRTLTVDFAEPVTTTQLVTWTITLDQQFGTQHTLGKFRVKLGRPSDPRPEADRRKEHFQQKYTVWLDAQRKEAVAWKTVVPQSWTSTLPKLELLPDGSLFSSGDLSKRDVFEFAFGPALNGATALRIEAIPDERLPKRGPGRVYYEGPHGDFFLSEIHWEADAQRRDWGQTAQSFASGNSNAAAAIDGNPLTGWSINGGQGRAHVAVFSLKEAAPEAKEQLIRLVFERYYAAGMGRFRFAVTIDPRGLTAAARPPELDALLAKPIAELTADDQAALQLAFCRVAPELAGERQKLEQFRQQWPAPTTTLVFLERPADNPRPTKWYRRGEFLQPVDAVQPGVPSFLHTLQPQDEPPRLAFAQWLVDRRNPLVARVTVNRHWQAFFGRGLVRTLEDFGYQGELPSHPELLDWLAVEFMQSDWSVKALHRRIVTSATYRQASTASPLLLERDPQNVLLARGPRTRLEAELVRDSVLHVAGLLSLKQGGPSVFPPQPANITTEGAYGQLAWTVSPGEDRYRRGLYTFSKRTAPYAMFTTFDGPSGEACVPRRDVSNTPLQALTLLNDAVFVEAAQALGRDWANRSGTTAERVTSLFRHCLTRSPTPNELQQLTTFVEAQAARLKTTTAEAAKLAGSDTGDVVATAAWTALARVILNLDEMITTE
jgi:hypothetical protein